ncbi:MAG: hypothetical protein Q9Q40_13485 [Acidobacteriota bacterium]|nr:hypothetical protein [Acidobacteriota bacterium]
MLSNTLSRKAVLLAMLTVTSGLPLSEAGRSAPMLEPLPITIPCEASTEEIRDTLLDVLESGVDSRRPALVQGSGWVPSLLQPDLIEATLRIRSHTLTVRIHFDKKQVRINYYDSINLNYRKYRSGAKNIHPNASKWMLNLRNMLQIAVSRLCSNRPLATETQPPSPASEQSLINCTLAQIDGMRSLGLSDNQIEAACSN